MIISSLLLAASLPAVASEAKAVKLATLAPEGSAWVKVLGELDQEVREKTAGALKLKIYAGGVSGEDRDVVKKMRIGQLHAAGLTGVGLGEIAPETRILDAPWLFHDYHEVDYVYQKFNKELAAAFEKGGFVLLGWVELGFVHIFSKGPINGEQDMRKAKMWVWEGDPIAMAAYKALGVSPIPLSIVDVMSSLQTGMVDAVYGPPLGVTALQWHSRTKHIYSLPVANSEGAVVIAKKFFDELPVDQRRVLLEASAKHLRRLNELVRRENAEALAALQKQGLTLSASPTPETVKHYQDLGLTARRELVGRLYSQQLLDRVERSLLEFRNGKARKG